MSIYVKLGLGWTLLHENEYAYLTNPLLEKTYQIQSEKIDIIRDIDNALPVEVLDEKYGKMWEEFREELQAVNAIYFDSNPTKCKSEINLGGRFLMNSSFIKLPPLIARLTIQINEKCNLNCEYCGEETQFSCLSCNADTRNRVISLVRATQAIDFISNFGVPELHIVGGDPLLNIDLLKLIICAYKKANADGKIWVYTNGLEVLNLSFEEEEFFKSKVNFVIIVNEINKLSIDSVFVKLRHLKIPYEIQFRNLDIDLPSNAFQNNSINYIDGKNSFRVSPSNLVRPITLYSNTVHGIKINCCDGRVFLSVDGKMGVCKEYLIKDSENDNIDSLLMDKIEKNWFNSDIDHADYCCSCGLEQLCFSCHFLKHKADQNSLSNDRDRFCFIDKEVNV